METLPDRYLRFLETGECSDITIYVGKEQVPIRAHKSVLIFGSSYFEEQLIGIGSRNQLPQQLRDNIVEDCANIDSMFEIVPATSGLQISGLDQESATNSELWIEDVEPEDFRLFLKFLYGGISIQPIKTHEALPLMLCSTKFKVPSLVSACEEVLGTAINLDSALTLLQQSFQYENANLQKAAADFVAKNAFDVVNRKEFTDLSTTALQLILERGDTEVYSEMQLFEAVVEWAKMECARQKLDSEDPTHIRSVLQPLLKHIRFHQMSPSDFGLKVAPLKILDRDQMVDILQNFYASSISIPPSRNFHVPSTERNIVKRLEWEPDYCYKGYQPPPFTIIRFKANKCVWISSIGIAPPVSYWPERTHAKIRVEAALREPKVDGICYAKAEKDINVSPSKCDHIEFPKPTKIDASTWYLIEVHTEIVEGQYYTYPFPHSEADVVFEFENTDTNRYAGSQIPEIAYHLDE